MNERTVHVVVGYHDHSSAPPEPATQNGLTQRIALVLDSFRSDKVDLYFDFELFLAGTRSVLDLLATDRIEVQLDTASEPIASLSDVAAHWRTLREVDVELPTLLNGYQGSSLACVATPELWARVGGPLPYHDSYTMSFFADYEDPLGVAERISGSLIDAGGDAIVIEAPHFMGLSLAFQALATAMSLLTA